MRFFCVRVESPEVVGAKVTHSGARQITTGKPPATVIVTLDLRACMVRTDHHKI